MTTKTNTAKPKKGEPKNDIAREHFRFIKAHAKVGPKHEIAVRFGAGCLALVQSNPTLEGMAEARRWLEALGLTPVRRVK